MLPQILFGLGLVGLSIFLLRMHRGERAGVDADTDNRQARRQAISLLRRRSISSALIGLAGMMVVGGVLIKSTVALAIYWSLALVVVILIITLGLMDFLRSRSYLRVLEAEHRKERAALEAEVLAHMKRRKNDADEEPND